MSNLFNNCRITNPYSKTERITNTVPTRCKSGAVEVHILPSETFADCNSYSNFQLQRNSSYDDGNSQNDVNNKGIELIFKLSDYQNSITVYPNPSNGNFLVKLNSEDRNLFLKKINVFDITGRIIFTIEVNTKSYLLNLSSLPKGIYFLNSTDLTRQYNNKIIIN